MAWIPPMSTDIMIETAKNLSEIKDKIIIQTGAMKPEKFSDSDAILNIGTAVDAANILESRTYIVMNGRVYPWNRVIRNMETGQFVGK